MPTKRQKIAVDIDEVLAPLHDVFFTYHNVKYGTNYPIRDPAGSYFMQDYTGEPHEVMIKKLASFVASDDFREIKSLEGAVTAIRKLQKDYNLEILTGRQSLYLDATHEWLRRHFPKTFSEVLFTEYITGEGLKVPKSEICRQIGADYLVDDSVKTAVECANVGLEVVLFGDYPWNQAATLPAQVTRCADWHAVVEYFDGR